MSTKVFGLVLLAVLAFGGGLGGAFVAGLAMGKSSDDESAVVASAGQLSLPSSGQQPNTGQFTPGAFLAGLEDGEIDPDVLDQIRSRFGGDFQQGVGGGPGLAGEVESFDGRTVTVNTAQGPLTAEITDGTTIQTFAEGTSDDIEAGQQVTVVGQPGDDGTVEATLIFISPEGDFTPFGGGGGQRRGFRGGQ